MRCGHARYAVRSDGDRPSGKVGDAIKTETPLVTLESDKATMDVPSPVDGVVKDIKIKLGDKVSEGSLLLTVEADVAPAGVAPREKIKEGGHATATGAPAADYGASGVYESIDVRVPDIGDFKDVPVIEVHVKSGDAVKGEDALITLESDKATMDVPSPAAGTVAELKIKLGDKVSEGTLILTLATGVAAAAAAPQAPGAARPAAAPAAVPAPAAASYAGGADVECEMLVLGAGPGGENGPRRTLRDVGRRVPERRLYSVQGAVAHCRGDGRSKNNGRARHHLRPAADRPRHAARVQGRRHQEADQRIGRHGQGPQGRGRPRRRAFS